MAIDRYVIISGRKHKRKHIQKKLWKAIAFSLQYCQTAGVTIDLFFCTFVSFLLYNLAFL